MSANGASMRKNILVLIMGVAAVLIASGPTFAHHGTAAYDTKNIVTVKGTMTDFRFINPHVQLFFDVKNDKGETEKWQAELTAPNKLTRAGWDKHTLKPGDSDHGQRLRCQGRSAHDVDQQAHRARWTATPPL